jgi:glucokinase
VQPFAPLQHAPSPPTPLRGSGASLVLVGDVGGTKTTLALADGSTGELLEEETVPSREHASFHDVIARFGAAARAPVDRAVFSVAGPVVAGAARITNLPWTLDEKGLRETLGGAPVALVNDLKATALAVPHLLPHQLLTLHEGEPDPGGVRGVLALGTGLGEALLVPAGAGFLAFASEGGHADFASRGPLQRRLHGWLEREHGQVSSEMVCSGLGIPNLYRFLAARTGGDAPLAAGPDPTPRIVAAGMARDGCPLCRRTLLLLGRIAGAEAGNVALRFLATGGVYLGGGIPPRILPVLRGRGFTEAYRGRGRLSDVVGRIPLHVILEPRAALIGAAMHALALS